MQGYGCEVMGVGVGLDVDMDMAVGVRLSTVMDINLIQRGRTTLMGLLVRLWV